MSHRSSTPRSFPEMPPFQSESKPPAGRKTRRPLFRRRSCWVPTWRGMVLFGLIAVVFAWGVSRAVYPFLALTDRVPAEILVVEGWSSDSGLKGTLEEFRRQGYRRLFVTGGPMEKGAPLSEHGSHARLGEAVLRRLGLETNLLEAVSAPRARRDRTYASAVALKERLVRDGPLPERIVLVSEGPHSRRSRLLFQKAFGEATTVGVVSIPPNDYDPDQWWRTSQGFRVVVSEAIAYLYARFLFVPSPPID